MLYVVLPAYNEEKALGIMLPELRILAADLKVEVIVVNDGSQDGTASMVRAAQTVPGLHVHLVDHPRNRGVGAAVRTGLLEAAKYAGPHDGVVTMDADGTHPIPLMREMAVRLAGEDDLVIASRFVPGGQEVGLAPHRKFLSHGACWLMRTLFPLPGARDYTCGYRAYRGDLLQRGIKTYGDELVTEDGFACQVELLLKLGPLASKIGEVPLVLRYDLKRGASKMRITRTIAQYGRVITNARRRKS